MPSGKLQQSLTGNPKWRTQNAKSTVLTLKPTVKDSPAIYVVGRAFLAQKREVYSGVGIFKWYYLSSPPQILRIPRFRLEIRGLTYTRQSPSFKLDPRGVLCMFL